MATIGSRSAVVELPVGIRLRGTLAWLAWLGLHLYTLLGNRQRIVTLVNLSWRYLTWSRGGGIIVGDDPAKTRLTAGRRRPALCVHRSCVHRSAFSAARRSGPRAPAGTRRRQGRGRRSRPGRPPPRRAARRQDRVAGRGQRQPPGAAVGPVAVAGDQAAAGQPADDLAGHHQVGAGLLGKLRLGGRPAP